MVELIAYLAEEAKEYKENILPLLDAKNNFENPDFVEFDEAKNEFLESLWDVIYQTFLDGDL